MNETFQQPGRWHDVILTPTRRPANEPLSHMMSFTLKGLQSASVYEAIVQAKNRYGWNEVKYPKVLAPHTMMPFGQIYGINYCLTISPFETCLASVLIPLKINYFL